MSWRKTADIAAGIQTPQSLYAGVISTNARFMVPVLSSAGVFGGRGAQLDNTVLDFAREATCSW
jgi:hypothetical protein